MTIQGHLVARFGQHWADLDKPAIPDEADTAEFQRVVGAYVDHVTDRYYEFMTKISNPPPDMVPSKFSEILIFQVRYGKGSDFRSAITRIYEASQKTKWPLHYEWYELVNGWEQEGEWVSSLPRSSWADFEDKPEVKPFRDMLKEAFGQAEADSIIDRLDDPRRKGDERDHPVPARFKLHARQIAARDEPECPAISFGCRLIEWCFGMARLYSLRKKSILALIWGGAAVHRCDDWLVQSRL